MPRSNTWAISSACAVFFGQNHPAFVKDLPQETAHNAFYKFLSPYGASLPLHLRTGAPDEEFGVHREPEGKC